MATNPDIAALQAAYDAALAASQAKPEDADLAKAADDAKAELAAAQVDAAKGKSSKVDVRVLRDEGDYTIDTVAPLSADDAVVAARDGWGDPNPAAVAFIKKEIAAKAARA
jgi:hypothetical protein